MHSSRTLLNFTIFQVYSSLPELRPSLTLPITVRPFYRWWPDVRLPLALRQLPSCFWRSSEAFRWQGGGSSPNESPALKSITAFSKIRDVLWNFDFDSRNLPDARRRGSICCSSPFAVRWNAGENWATDPNFSVL